jgi:hypothetical protein
MNRFRAIDREAAAGIDPDRQRALNQVTLTW